MKALFRLLMPVVFYLTTSFSVNGQYADRENYLLDWLIAGPVPVLSDTPAAIDENDQLAAFRIDPDPSEFSNASPGVSLQLADSQYAWKQVRSDSYIINLREVCSDTTNVIAYASTDIESETDRKVLLGVGSDDAVKVWLNGELIHEFWGGRGVEPQEDLVQADLKKGSNRLVLKVQNMELDWGFRVRMLEKDGLAELLSEASRLGDLDNIDMLVSYGADVNALNSHGLSSYQVATIQKRKETMKLLAGYGARTDLNFPSANKYIASHFNPTLADSTAGAAVLVARDGEILYQGGFGFANIKEGIKVTPNTKFRIGSVSKQFTAAAIMKLQEEGKIAVMDKLSQYIPDFPRGNEVTIHHLLTHTSGIHSYTNDAGFLDEVTEPVTEMDLIQRIKGFDYDFDPGERWMYNNSAYFILGYLVGKLSGSSYGDYLNAQFFEPLNMSNTGVYDNQEENDSEAVGYQIGTEGFSAALDWDMSWAGGAGALYSTVLDLNKWNEALYDGDILSEGSLEAMMTPVVLNDGSVADANYGYGLSVATDRGLITAAHSGGLHGFNSYLIRYPDQDYTITMLSNALPVPEYLNPVITTNLIAEFYLWEFMDEQESFRVDPALQEADLSEYAGQYEYPGGAIMTISTESGHLYAQLTGQGRIEIYPRVKDEFFWKVVDAQITFVRDAEGNVVSARHRQAGQEFAAPRVEEQISVELTTEQLARLVGEYAGPGGMAMKILLENNQLYTQLNGQPRFKIYPSAEYEFYLKVVVAKLVFNTAESGEVVSVTLLQGGNVIQFEKED